MIIPMPILPSVGDVKLGKLVTSINYPQQANLEVKSAGPPPQCSPAQFHLKQDNAQENDWLSALNALISAKVSRQTKRSYSIASRMSYQYLLKDSDAWFDTIVALDETRRWIEQQAYKGKSMYLIEGFRTLVDPQVKIESAKDSEVSGSLDVKDAIQALVAAGVINIPTDISVQGSYGSSKAYSASLEAPGEKIWCIQYRKIKWNWLDKYRQQNAHLENKTRSWIALEGQMRDASEDEEDEDDGAVDDEIFHVSLDSLDAQSNDYMLEQIQQDVI